MTRSEKLDKILYVLLSVYQRELDYKKIGKLITMDFLGRSLKLELEQWEEKSLQDELLSERYISVSGNNEVRITNDGIKFITRGRGYRHADDKNRKEELIIDRTIEKFRYDKVGFWLSIVALGISVASFVYQFFS